MQPDLTILEGNDVLHIICQEAPILGTFGNNIVKSGIKTKRLSSQLKANLIDWSAGATVPVPVPVAARPVCYWQETQYTSYMFYKDQLQDK